MDQAMEIYQEERLDQDNVLSDVVLQKYHAASAFATGTISSLYDFYTL
jgi:hypothetical protein